MSGRVRGPATGHPVPAVGRRRTGRGRALTALTALTALATVAPLPGPPSYARSGDTGADPAGTDPVVALFEADAAAASIDTLPRIVLDAHRSGGLEARENSLSAIEHALDSGVVDVIDLDVRRLADGTLGVMHDATVDRVTTSTGPTSTYTQREWRKLRLDIGSWLDPEPPAEAPPMLAAVLERYGDRSVFTLEVKEGLVDELARLLRADRLTDSVFVNTNRLEVARLAHQLGLRTHLWRTRAQMRTDRPRRYADWVDLVDVDLRARRADVERFVSSGIPLVWAHTITTRAERDRALRWGATGIVTDAPRYVAGVSDVLPVSPTVLALRPLPRRLQVSDRTTVRAEARSQSGPLLDEAKVTVSSPQLRGRRTAHGDDGTSTLRLSAAVADTGRTRVWFRAAAGRDGERRWQAGRTTARVHVTGEDLDLIPSVRTAGRRLQVGVRLRDSAAPGYDGPRAERGRRERTVAGLTRAGLRLQVLRKGEVVHRDRLTGADTGRPGDGAGTVTFDRWRAGTRGWYTVRVEQRGRAYRQVAIERRVRLR